MSATSTESPWARAPDGALAAGEDSPVTLPYWCDRASGPGWVALGHGAGAGPLHPVLEGFTEVLNTLGWNVLRYAFPFRAARPEARIGRDAPALGQAAVAAAFAAAKGLAGVGPVVLAGHSYGARRTLECLAQRPLPAAGALLLAYPLVPPKRRTLAPLPRPKGRLQCGFVSGERDSHAPPGTLEAALADRPEAQLWRIPRADHGWSRAQLFELGGPLRQALEGFLTPLLEGLDP